MCNVPLDDGMLESQGHEFRMAAARQDGLAEATYRLESRRQIDFLKSAGAIKNAASTAKKVILFVMSFCSS